MCILCVYIYSSPIFALPSPFMFIVLNELEEQKRKERGIKRNQFLKIQL